MIPRIDNTRQRAGRRGAHVRAHARADAPLLEGPRWRSALVCVCIYIYVCVHVHIRVCIWKRNVGTCRYVDRHPRGES